MNDYTAKDIAGLSTDEKLTAQLTICLSNQAKLASIDAIKEDIATFKQEVTERCEASEQIVSGFNDRLTALEDSNNAHVHSTNKRFILGDLYGKKFNTLFHGVDDTNAEEDMATKQRTVELILGEYLCIPDWQEKITFVDTHRLPQTPVKPKRASRNARSVCRLVVIKVSTKEEHDIIYKHLKNLAGVNSGRDSDARIYATKNLPKEMQSQRNPCCLSSRRPKKKGTMLNLKLTMIQLITDFTLTMIRLRYSNQNKLTLYASMYYVYFY